MKIRKTTNEKSSNYYLGGEVGVGEAGPVAVEEVGVQELVVARGGGGQERHALKAWSNVRYISHLDSWFYFKQSPIFALIKKKFFLFWINQ